MKKREPWYFVLHIYCILNLAWYGLFHLNSFRPNADYIYVILSAFCATMGVLLIFLGVKARMRDLLSTGIAGTVFWCLLIAAGNRISRSMFRHPAFGYELFSLISVCFTVGVILYIRKIYDKICIRKQVFSGKGKRAPQPAAANPASEASQGMAGSVSADRQAYQNVKSVLEKAAKEPAAEQARLDVNECTAEELADLPGVSLATAKRMIELREQRGGFASVDEFVMEAGIKPHFAVKILERLTVTEKEKPKRVRSHGRKLDI